MSCRISLQETASFHVANQKLVLQTLKAAADERDFIAAQMAAGGLLAVLLEAAAERLEIGNVVSLSRLDRHHPSLRTLCLFAAPADLL